MPNDRCPRCDKPESEHKGRSLTPPHALVGCPAPAVDWRARALAAEERAKSLYTAVSLVASALRVKHAHYEDAHLDPKPRRPIPWDEADWLRMLLEHAEKGNAEAVQGRAEAQIEVLLREARAQLDEAWSKRPVGTPWTHSTVLTWEPTDYRPLSVRDLLARIDAALKEDS